MSLLKKAYDGAIALLAIFAGVSVIAMTAAVVIDVLMRATGFNPPAVTSALVEYLLLYFALFTAPYLVRKKGHVVIDALVVRLPGSARGGVEKLAYAISIVTALLFAYISLQLLLDSIDSGRFDERSVDIPMWLLYLPMPFGFFFVATEFARYLFGADRFFQELTDVKDSV